MSESHSFSGLTAAAIPFSITRHSSPVVALSIPFPISFPPIPIRQSSNPRVSTIVSRSASPMNSHNADEEEEDNSSEVQDLRVPDHWLLPSKAREESEWLKVTLQKWLDDEYCPEETNVQISSVAAQSYYESLVGKRTDLGEILLKMAKDLESISYQESFHGAFSSANAAVSLIVQRIEIQGISASS